MSDASSSDEPKRDNDDNESRDAQDTAAILARRRRFVVAAMSSLALSATEACSPPAPCLEYVNPDTGVDARGADSSVADTGVAPDVGPQPCLSPPFDAGVVTDTGVDSTSPMPCLSPPFDSGVEDAAPSACLRIAPTDSGVEDTGNDAAPAACLRMVPPRDE